MAMTTIRTTTERFLQTKHCVSSIDKCDLETDTICVGQLAKLRSPRPYLSGVDRIFLHTLGISISSKFVQKGHHRQESATHQLLRRRRSSWIALSNGACTVQVLQSKFWRRENCWSIQIIHDRSTDEASSTSFVKKYTPTQGFFFIDAISPQCMCACGALVTAPRFSPNLGLAYRLLEEGFDYCLLSSQSVERKKKKDSVCRSILFRECPCMFFLFELLLWVLLAFLVLFFKCLLQIIIT